MGSLSVSWRGQSTLDIYIKISIHCNIFSRCNSIFYEKST